MQRATVVKMYVLLAGTYHQMQNGQLLRIILVEQLFAGGKLKEVGTTHWWIPNEGATNETGFTAIPGGGRIKDGDFYGHFGHIGEIGFWWSQTTNVSDRMLRYNDGEVDLFSVFPKQCGFSIRCVQDISAPMITTTEITSITQTTASGGGNIRTDIMSPVTARGVCWNTAQIQQLTLLQKQQMERVLVLSLAKLQVCRLASPTM